jgi:hypothetical protein
VSKFLEPRDAYFAGLHDLTVAIARTEKLIGNRRVSKSQRELILRAELDTLWQGRIDRGEIPGYQPHLVWKAS